MSTTPPTILKKPLPWKAPEPAFESKLVDLAIRLALAEDLGPALAEGLNHGAEALSHGDVTSSLCIEPDRNITAGLVVKEPAVIAGLNVAIRVFSQVDETVNVEILSVDGSRVTKPPTPIARISGSARAILGAERTALNFLQRLCGVATLTAAFVDRVAGTGIMILDTRKTTPGLRVLEKQAVLSGGGVNHRFGLSSAILIKDNHIAAAGGVAAAVTMVKAREPEAKIEVEAQTLQEVRQAVQCGVQAIMLDNMSPDMVQAALKLIPGSCFVELSGGVTLNNIDQYLIEGVDAISIGALTHSAPGIDISLEVEDYGH